MMKIIIIIIIIIIKSLRCGLVVRVPGYRSTGPSSIPGATTFSEKCSGSGTGSTQPLEYYSGATWKKRVKLRSRKPRIWP
jgi:hypothetical protein